MAVQPEDVRLLANDRFRRLLGSRAVSHVAQNAVLYTLLILVVNETDSSVQSTILITALILPSIVLGIPVGGLADILPRRALLVLGHALRAVLVVAMIGSVDDLWTIYLLVLAFSTVSQLVGPAEASALRDLVRPNQLASGNSWLQLATMLGQGMGAVILAPFLLKLFNVEVSLAVAVAVYAGAVIIAWTLTGLPARSTSDGVREARSLGGMFEGLTAGWSVLRSSRRAFLALVYLTIVWTLAKAVAVLAPRYTRDVLDINTENTVFVVAPAAIGALVALLLTPPLVRWLGAVKVAAAGFVLYILGIVALGLVVLVRDFIVENIQLGFAFVEQEVGVSSISVVTMAMILAIPVGFAATAVSVAGKAILNQEAPGEKQARVFATQTALSDALSLLPLFAIGAVAELVGVREVLLVAAVIALVAGVYLTFSRRFGPPEQVQPAQAD